jgi:hypothetical protein
MNTAQIRQAFAPRRGNNLARGAIDWEELPSMQDVALRMVARAPIRQVDLDLSGGPSPLAANSQPARFDHSAYGPRTGWDNTAPADLEMPAPTEPFRETLQGLSMREVREPDVFRHFFG